MIGVWILLITIVALAFLIPSIGYEEEPYEQLGNQCNMCPVKNQSKIKDHAK